MKIKKLTAINAKVGSPILPRNERDPARQFGNLRSAKAQLNRRYKSIKKGVRALINTFEPTLKTNAAVYEYRLDAQRYQNINEFLKRLLYDNLLDNQQGQFSRRWWLNTNLNAAYTSGTADSLQSAKNIAVADIVGQEISQTIRSTELEQIVFSPSFQSRVNLLQSRVFEEMKGMTDSTKVDLAETLARGMAKGSGVRELAKDTMARIDVSHNRAIRIVRTETLNAYRTASAQETDRINEDVYDDSDFGMIQLWFSALADTTRRSHAIRHGETYTTQETKEFYSIIANAINCLCSQSNVLQNKKTGEILQSALQERMREQKQKFIGVK